MIRLAAVFLIAVVALACVASAGAQTAWKANPKAVLTPGPAGAWDAGDIQTGGVAKVGDHYLMVYAGRAPGSPMHGENSIGVATSTDGLKWTKYAHNPVLGPDGRSPCLLYEPSDKSAPYKMWYGNFNKQTEATEIRCATSPDGLHWKEVGTALTRTPGTFDEQSIAHAAVVKARGTYFMYYDAIAKPGTVPAPERCVAVATSTDAVHWTKVGPALKSGGAAVWDYSVGDPDVIYKDGQFLMWYKGMAPKESTALVTERLGFATSKDGLTFTRYAGNPILSPSADPRRFPHGSMFGPSVIWDGSVFRMWFGGPNVNKLTGFGYAASKP
jgi:predicted GH43/DUF377 family glycosyl hydrolase